jgi:hypothetical protein
MMWGLAIEWREYKICHKNEKLDKPAKAEELPKTKLKL